LLYLIRKPEYPSSLASSTFWELWVNLHKVFIVLLHGHSLDSLWFRGSTSYIVWARVLASFASSNCWILPFENFSVAFISVPDSNLREILGSVTNGDRFALDLEWDDELCLFNFVHRKRFSLLGIRKVQEMRSLEISLHPMNFMQKALTTI
jgi:hypothetical protein